MSFGQVLLIAVLIALNGFFVGVEFSVVASRRTRLDLIAGADGPAARAVRRWLDDNAARDRIIAATQLGITVVSLALGAAGENAFEAWLSPYFKSLVLPAQWEFLKGAVEAMPLVLSLAVVTSFHVVLGEQVPKVAVLRAPERFALASAPVMQVFSAVFRWFIGLLDWATRAVLRLIGLPPDGHTHSAVGSLEELRQIVSSPEVERIVEQPEQEMLSAVIDFGGLVARQVAIPRTEIVAVEAATPLREVAALAAEEGVTKLPVYEENMDQILGVLHVRDLLRRMVQGDLEQATARDLVRDVLYIPESVPVNDLLVQFRARKTHIAIVLDEFGGTLGLVTLEDLLEEIVGDVQDPFDVEPPSIQVRSDGTALIDGMTLIEEINAAFDLHLSDPNYDTIAGFVLGRLDRIPQAGDTVEDPDHRVRLRVAGMDRLRIAQVELTRL